MSCIQCQKENTAYQFHTLEVLTLHVRDLGGEKRVQALGEFADFSVCADCARERYEKICRSNAALVRKLLPFLALTAAGCVMTLLFLRGDGAFRLLGLAMLTGGLLGTFGTFQNGSKKKKELLAMGMEAALRACAWDCLVDYAPRKCDVNDITYIPVDETTLSRKNGDLMVLYDLLPQIAVQAYDRIHDIESAEEP